VLQTAAQALQDVATFDAAGVPTKPPDPLSSNSPEGVEQPGRGVVPGR
jgi:hypothetical protein